MNTMKRCSNSLVVMLAELCGFIKATSWLMVHSGGSLAILNIAI
jgi:hypothetical protein